MLKNNVGTIDRAVRFTLALALFSLFYFLDGPYMWLGLIGIVPLATGLLGSCPLYTLFGMNTCPLEKREA
ncbi:MAG: DUF2892 domain-containing protein [Myxococcales bacterium]|nr:DUF2892 domain-containing protein [Myxococcales bacterium]